MLALEDSSIGLRFGLFAILNEDLFFETAAVWDTAVLVAWTLVPLFRLWHPRGVIDRDPVVQIQIDLLLQFSIFDGDSLRIHSGDRPIGDSVNRVRFLVNDVQFENRED